MTIILGMAGLSVASRFLTIILGKMNKVDDAACVDVVTSCLMIGTVATAVAGALASAAKIGR